MTKKVGLFWLLMAYVLTVGFLVIRTNEPPAYKKGTSASNDKAIATAKSVFKQQIATGVDMSSGPCLSNDLMKDWVADVVHSPREPVDDLPENQCQAYLERRASHFVELDTSGNLVRVF